VEDVLQQVAELQKVVRRLRLRRKQIAGSKCSCSGLAEKQSKTPPMAHTKGRGVNNAGEWTLATARTTRRKRLPLNPEVKPEVPFVALRTEEEMLVTSGEMLEPSEAARSAPLITTHTTKKRQWGIVVVNSLLGAT